MPADRITGWVVTLVITATAFVLRVVNLGYPNKLVFDETYYAKDAYSLLKFGYERNWPADANPKVVAGTPDVMQTTASFIVHPPVGKWLIAAGEALFGMNSFGWRVAPLVFGTLLVLVTIRLVRRVSKSTLIGGLAGLLLTFDGLAFVMSRTALLDIFVAFFVVAAVSCLAADRDWFRNRLADHLERTSCPTCGAGSGPRCWSGPGGWPPACASGWPSAASGTPSTCWPRSPCCPWPGTSGPAGWPGPAAGPTGRAARRRTRLRLAGRAGRVVYLGTWAGWLSTSGGYDRDWGANNPDARTAQLLRRDARVVGALPEGHLELPHRRLHQQRRALRTGPTRPAGWWSPGRSASTRSTTSSRAPTAASVRTTASG